MTAQSSDRMHYVMQKKCCSNSNAREMLTTDDDDVENMHTRWINPLCAVRFASCWAENDSQQQRRIPFPLACFLLIPRKFPYSKDNTQTMDGIDLTHFLWDGKHWRALQSTLLYLPSQLWGGARWFWFKAAFGEWKCRRGANKKAKAKLPKWGRY